MSIVVLSDGSVERLNSCINDLQLDCSIRISAEDLRTSPFKPVADWVALCLAVLEKLQFYDEQIQEGYKTLSVSSGAKDIFDVISSRSPPFLLASNLIEYRILGFIVSQLQAERLRKYSAKGANRRESAAEKGRIAFQLDKICKDFDVGTDVEESMLSEIFCNMLTKIRADVDAVSLDSFHNPAKIISTEVESLSAGQIELFENIAESFFEDFSLRRKMLMTRLDVTIQSFLWGEKAQGKEGEIVAAIQEQRKHLDEIPTRYTLSDVLAAPQSLLYENSKKVTQQGGRKSLVKSVIIGAVPDRGGRADEMRPKAERPQFSSHKGGGGKGRGGGKVNAGGNQKGKGQAGEKKGGKS